MTGSNVTFHWDHPSSAVSSTLPTSMPAPLRSDLTFAVASSFEGIPAGRAGAGMSHGANDGHDPPGAHGGTAHPMATLTLPEPDSAHWRSPCTREHPGMKLHGAAPPASTCRRPVPPEAVNTSPSRVTPPPSTPRALANFPTVAWDTVVGNA